MTTTEQMLVRLPERLIADHLPNCYQACKEYRNTRESWSNVSIEEFNKKMILILKALLHKKVAFDIAFSAIAAQHSYWLDTVDGRELNRNYRDSQLQRKYQRKFSVVWESYTSFLLHFVTSCCGKGYSKPIPPSEEHFNCNSLLKFFNQEYWPNLTTQHITFTFFPAHEQQLNAVHSFLLKESAGRHIEKSISQLIVDFADYSFAPFLRVINTIIKELGPTQLCIPSNLYTKKEWDWDCRLSKLLVSPGFIKHDKSVSVPPLKYLADCLLFEHMFRCSAAWERRLCFEDFIGSVPASLVPLEFISIVEDTFALNKLSMEVFAEWIEELLQETDIFFCCSLDDDLEECRKT